MMIDISIIVVPPVYLSMAVCDLVSDEIPFRACGHEEYMGHHSRKRDSRHLSSESLPVDMY